MHRNDPKATPTTDTPILQWANGKTMARPYGNDKARFAPLVGWHMEIDKDGDLDAALGAASMQMVEIKHQRDGGAVVVAHWYLGEQVHFRPLTTGPVAASIAACIARRGDMAAAGLGVAWPDGERSRFAVRGYVDELWAAGYTFLVQLGVKSRMTDELLAALIDHHRVIVAADAIRANGETMYHEIALPLVAGDEAEWGKGDTATVVPFRSGHPAEVGREYLRAAYRNDAVHNAAREDWDSVVAWASTFGATPIAGDYGRH